MLRLRRAPIFATEVGVVTFVQAIDLSVQGDECDHGHRDFFLAAGDGELEWLPGRKQARLRPRRSAQTAPARDV
jgi:hypothetical protein